MSPSLPDTASSSRELRLDMFRGLALVMIFINHVPGTVYEHFTNRNFGFSDAAEAFVFMSGMAAGLAYSKAFRIAGPLATTLRIWARARQLYFVHLAMTLIAAAIFIAAALWFDLPTLLERNNMARLLQSTPEALMGLPLMTFQLGYLNILPLYIVLLIAAPLMIAIALRSLVALIALSVLVWWTAGGLEWTFPRFPGNGGWFLNPFAWQIMFTVGLACGISMKRGQALVPFRPVLFGLAAIVVVGSAVWMQIPEVGSAGRSVLSRLNALGVPDYIVWFNKNALELPRALHAFALFYVMASIPALERLSRSAVARPLVVLGQSALPVFAVGTLIAIALQALKTAITPGPLGDGALFATGLLIQFGLAYALGHIRRGFPKRSGAAKPATGDPSLAPAQ